jgi:hypothetical protein
MLEFLAVAAVVGLRRTAPTTSTRTAPSPW